MIKLIKDPMQNSITDFAKVTFEIENEGMGPDDLREIFDDFLKAIGYSWDEDETGDSK